MRQVRSRRSEHDALPPSFPIEGFVCRNQCCVHGPLLRVSALLDRTIFAVQISLTAVPA